MDSLFRHILWRQFPLTAGAALGQTTLSIGEVGNKGPIALVTAGVHGDEGPWGAWAIRKLLMNTAHDELLGTLRIVPVSNPFAMEADARNAPFDTLDLNRQFPGDPKGSHTERLAALLTANALSGVDIAIDLHGGGSWCVNAFAFQVPGGEAISQAFGAPFIVTAPDRTVTLTGYARSQGAVVAAIEMGGRSEFEEQWADRIAAGLRRALGIAGVLTPTDDQPPQQSIAVSSSTVLRPSQGGIFIPEIRANGVGTVIDKGKVMGYLMDSVSQEIVETFTAPFERTAVLLLRPMMARVEGGAMTYVVAQLLE